MASPRFVAGQRWISQGETELGLGLVAEMEGRHVRLFFPAAEAYRTYAGDDAPLTRYRLEPGQSLTDEQGQTERVIEVREQQGLLYYLVERDGAECWIDELELGPFVELSRPQDRLFAGQIDGHKAFELRRLARQLEQRLDQSDVAGLLGARVQLLPHQFYIASQVAQRHAPRVLLADEVGLGKTIEAGLVIHQQVLSGRAERVLVVVPDSLVHQWLVEMLRRFNLHFSLFSQQQYQALSEAAGADLEYSNPFESSQLVICPLSLLTQDPQALEQAGGCQWDLLIVDEAHHLEWTEQQASREYLAIERLSEQAAGLLLLTATPEQLGIEGHFARLRLIDPARYPSLAAFTAEEADYQPVRSLVEQLLEAPDLVALLSDPGFVEALGCYVDSSKYKDIGDLCNSEIEVLRQRLIGQLLDQHGTGRVLFRNTREQIKGFPKRRLVSHLLEIDDSIAQQLAEQSLSDQLHPERLWGGSWLKYDPRVGWLQDWLIRHADDKVLLICADAKTSMELEEHLRLRVGIRSAVFHEGMSLINRDRAAAYFADPEQGAQLLVCSEIGSEGRNFQFAHQLVMFDLPLNPDLVEQRIGRLDRIGQRRDVEIHVPVYRCSSAHHLLRWLDEGLNAFLTPCAYGQALLQHTQQLEQQLQLRDEQQFQAFVEQTREQAKQLQQQQQQGRDRLLELNSFRPQQADEVLAQLQQLEDPQPLREFLDRCFDHFGVDQQLDGEHALIVEPGDHMHSAFPGLPEDGLHGSFDRQQALEREDLHFLSWEHPLVRSAFAQVTEADVGNTAICTLKLPQIKAGTLLVECLYHLQCPAPKALQVGRYLPERSFRVLLTADGRDCSSLFSVEQMASLATPLPKQAANNLVKPLRKPVEKLLEVAERLANKQLPAMVEQAQVQMQALQLPRLERLQDLARSNPAIRQQEIESQKLLIEQLAAQLQHAQLKLDGLQVLITN